jgi:excisionase family DNA binding protein
VTVRNRECKVQVHASRASARIGTLTALALALALTRQPATRRDRQQGAATASGPARQARTRRQKAPEKGTLGGSNRLLSARDVAAILAVSERTIRDNWREWGLPAYRIGRHLRWKERDVYAWIDRQAA